MIKRNIKMVVTSEESQQVQEICFANEIFWMVKGKECNYTDRKFLYIDDHLTWGSHELSFKEDSKEEVDATFFIRTKGTCVEENQEFKVGDKDLIKLNIEDNIESLVQDYKAKPKQYLVFVPQKGKPKHIHQSLESAQEEAQRLCRKELTEVMVLEVVSNYQAKIIVEEV